MATTKLVQRCYGSTTNKTGSTLIFVQYCHQYKTTLISTSEKVPPEFWDKNRQEVRKSYRGYSTLNMVIKKKKEEIDNLAREAKLFGIEPTADYIKDQLKGKKKEAVQVPSLFKFIEQYIVEQEGLKMPFTLRSYRTSFRQLKEYRDYLNLPINYGDIDMAFYDSFLKYLFVKRKLSNNSAGSHIKNLKLWLGVAFERGYHQNLIFKNKKFKVLQETADTIYLNEQELDLFYNYNLSANKKLERVRDLFYIGCWTALRYSDLSQLKPENIQNGCLRVNTKKTDELVIIPIYPKAQLIMDKYLRETGNPIPKAPSSQKFNEYLKELGKLVGLNQPIIIRESRGGKIEQNIYLKSDLLTSHCCRRSACTNLFKMGVSPLIIMRVSGHRTERNFLRYVKLSQESSAEMLKNFWEKLESKPPITPTKTTFPQSINLN